MIKRMWYPTPTNQRTFCAYFIRLTAIKLGISLLSI